MYKMNKKKKELIKRIITYVAMVLTVIVSVVMVTFLVLGFRFNLGKGEIEQYSFLRFNSVPSGAKVTVDGVVMSAKTPNKGSVEPGKHTVVMEKNGYELWAKTINVAAGTLKWLNYTLFVPKVLSVQPIADYTEIYSSVPSPTKRSILIQPKADSAVFDLVEIAPDTPKTTNLVLPATIYSDSETVGVSHSFQIKKWDQNGRYVLVKHQYADKFEWIVVDINNITFSKNITRTFDIVISDIDFAGTSGNSFYVIDSGDLRKLDLAATTITRPLVSEISSMNVYGSNIVAYAGKAAMSLGQVIGIYRDGDESSYVLRTIADLTSPINVATFRYFNEDYVAYFVGKAVTVLGGTYPTDLADSETSMKEVTSFISDSDIIDFKFSPTGEFLAVRSSALFYTYDLEYQSLVTFGAGCSAVAQTLDWLNDNYIWSSCSDSLVIKEFDGENSHTINPVVAGQAISLTHNGKYLYSIGKTEAGYQLQRVRMILP